MVVLFSSNLGDTSSTLGLVTTSMMGSVDGMINWGGGGGGGGMVTGVGAKPLDGRLDIRAAIVSVI